MNELITAETMPQAKNDAAKQLLSLADRIVVMLPATVEKHAFAASIIVAANELTKNCTPISVIKSALHAAQLGLVVGGALQHAFFVPFYNKTISHHECQLITGYQGFLQLALSSDYLKSIYADVVLGGEEWEHSVTETGPKLHHVPHEDRKLDWQNIKRSYCVWQSRSGGWTLKVVTKGELQKVYKEKSEAWRNNPAAMCQKTALLRAAKWWQKTPELALALRLDEEAEREVPQSTPENMPAITEKEIKEEVTLDSYSTPIEEAPAICPWEIQRNMIEELSNSTNPEDVARAESRLIASGTEIPKEEYNRLKSKIDERFGT